VRAHPRAEDYEPPVIPPPSDLTVFYEEREPLLYLPDGTALDSRRRIGFRVEGDDK
jgi:hypothetical protein